MNRLVCAISLLAGVLLMGGARAQTATALPSLPGTTPLVTESRPSVGEAGIPLGAIELAAPGISPGGFTGCSPASASTGPMFDGGGMSPAPPAACDMAGNALPLTASTSTLPTITGRAGIPLGSVELGLAGLSPAAPSIPPSMPFVSPSAPSGISAACPDASSALAPGSC
jgi:hypothetical protein